MSDKPKSDPVDFYGATPLGSLLKLLGRVISEPDRGPKRQGEMLGRIASALLIGIVLVGSASAEASQRKLRLDVVAQPVADVVDTLSFMSGIPVTTVGKLTGLVQNWSVNESGVEAFAKLGNASNLFVAFDGSRVIIAPKQEVATVIFERKGRSRNMTISAIHALFPLLPEDAVRQDQDSGLVLVRGPQIFVKAIEDVLSRQETEEIRVFNGGQMEVIRVPHAQEIAP